MQIKSMLANSQASAKGLDKRFCQRTSRTDNGLAAQIAWNRRKRPVDTNGLLHGADQFMTCPKSEELESWEGR